jgi:hypothetical protein
VSCGAYYIAASKIIIGRIIEVYTSLAILKLVSYVNVEIRSITNDYEMYFYIILAK